MSLAGELSIVKNKRERRCSVQTLQAELEERSRTTEQLEGSLAAARDEIQALNAKANDLRCVKPRRFSI
jgi:predicted RNase H-like nuclease (RuvC/YqgF family)